MELDQKERKDILSLAAFVYNSEQMGGFERWAEGYAGNEASKSYVSDLLENIRVRNSSGRRIFGFDEHLIEDLLVELNPNSRINRAA